MKPENFMLGVNDTICLIDFELGLRYLNPFTDRHIPAINGCDIVGTIRYTSVNSHMGLQQSRRDDLESLAYILCKGNFHGKTHQVATATKMLCSLQKAENWRRDFAGASVSYHDFFTLRPVTCLRRKA
jgi:serine/threonine protein kinase